MIVEKKSGRSREEQSHLLPINARFESQDSKIKLDKFVASYQRPQSYGFAAPAEAGVCWRGEFDFGSNQKLTFNIYFIARRSRKEK